MDAKEQQGRLSSRLSHALFSPGGSSVAGESGIHGTPGGGGRGPSPNGTALTSLGASPRATIDAQRLAARNRGSHARGDLLSKRSSSSSSLLLSSPNDESNSNNGNNAPNEPRTMATPVPIHKRKSSFIQDVLSTTPASIHGTDNPHDKVQASELTPILMSLELQTDELLPIFEYYCAYGSAYNLELLKLTNFLRFVKDSGCLPGVQPSEIQVLFVRSTKAVTSSATKTADERIAKTNHGGDTTCLTYANWLEAICRISRLRLDARQARLVRLGKIAAHKKRTGTNMSASRNMFMVAKMKSMAFRLKTANATRHHQQGTSSSGFSSSSPGAKKTTSGASSSSSPNGGGSESFAKGARPNDHFLEIEDLEREINELNEFPADLSTEVDAVIEKYILCNAERLTQLPDATELLEAQVTEVIRSDLPNLEVMFAYYSDAQRKEEALIGETELTRFATDFGLMPRLLTKLELFRIFRKVGDGRFNLGFPDFLECVGRAALTAFNKPYFATAYPSNAEKVAGFLQWLEDSGFQRKIIEHDRLRGHGYKGRRLTSQQLLGARASEETGLKPSQAMLRRLTETKSRHDISEATKQRAHEEAFGLMRDDARHHHGMHKSPGAAEKRLAKRSGLRRLSSEFNMPSTRTVSRRQSLKHELAALGAITGSAGGGDDSGSDISEVGDYDLIKNTGGNPFRVEQRRSPAKIRKGPKMGSSIFSSPWGRDKSLMRAVSAIEPYREALHEVFEFYCFYNNRKRLNVTELNATNWAKLCRDCHLVLDPRGAALNRDESVVAMEKSGCWVTPGEVDVIFVRSATADTHISGLDHGVLTFQTFQLALARLVRIIDSRAGNNLRQYRHEFSSFEDGHHTDFAYYHGAHDGDVAVDLEVGSDDTDTHHTSLSIRSAIAAALKSKGEDENAPAKEEGDGGGGGGGETKGEKIEAGNEKMATAAAPVSESPHEIEKQDEASAASSPQLHNLGPGLVDHHLLKLSVAAVDSGGAMTYVHRYDHERRKMLSLAEALALVVSRCILPHASRMTCDGYGKNEALKVLKVLAQPSVIQVMREESEFMEKLFLYYAEMRDEKLLGVVHNKHKHSTITFAEVMDFGKDFTLLPSLATQTELFMCFRACRRAPHKSKDRATMLMYPEFVECLARMSLICFSKPYLNEHHPEPQHKVHGFFGWLRASNGLKKIQTYEWLHGRGRGGIAMTQKILEGGTTTLKTNQEEFEREHAPTKDNEYTRLDRTMALIRKCSKEQHGRHLDLATLFEAVDQDGNGQISKDEFVLVLGEFIPDASEQMSQLSPGTALTPITHDDVGKLYEYFDSDGNENLDYAEFAYQFYNRGKVSNRLKAKQQGDSFMRHSHKRGTIADDTGELMFDMDFVDNMTGDKPLTRTEVARLQAHMRKVAYSYSGLDPLKFFAMVDADNNGLLDLGEFTALMRKIQGRFRNEEYKSGDQATSNHHGHEIGSKVFADKITDAEIKFIFNLIDTDQSGEISVQELSEFLEENKDKRNGQWKNAMDMAREMDLLEHERKRQAYIIQREKAGRERYKARKKAAKAKRREERKALGEDAVSSSSDEGSSGDDNEGSGPLTTSHEYHAKMKQERVEKRRQKKIDRHKKIRKKKYQAPTIGTILSYEEHADKRKMKRRKSPYKSEVHYKKDKKEESVWDKSLQDVPTLFRKTPGEDKTIQRLRKAKAKADREKFQLGHRSYTPIKRKSRSHAHDHGGRPNLHGWVAHEEVRREGRLRRATAQANMHSRLGKRPMYLSNVAKEAQDTEAEAVDFRTSKSIPAQDRLKQQRRDKLVADSKRAVLHNGANKVENFLGYKTTDQAVSAVDAAIGNGAAMGAGAGANASASARGGGGGGGEGARGSSSAIECLTELEALALHPAHQGPAMVTGKSAKKKKRSEHERLRSRKALRHKQHTQHSVGGKTPQHDDPKGALLVTPKPAAVPRAGATKSTAAARSGGTRNRNSADTSRRRGSYFGMTTHGTTQRRKEANKAKFHGYANEYGVAIRPHSKDRRTDLHKGWTHAHTTSSHARSGGNYAGVDHRDHHEKRRVKKRTAFGSTETVREDGVSTKNRASSREMSADDVAALSLISSPTAASKRRILEKGKSMATAEAQEREKEKLEGKLRAGSNSNNQHSGRKKPKKTGKKHRSPRRKSHHQGIKKGWSPAVIRGTSVTAHTHTSSSLVLSAAQHPQLNDSAAVSEQQLETGIEAAFGLNAGL